MSSTWLGNVSFVHICLHPMRKMESGKLPPIIMDKEVITGYLRSPPGVVFEQSLIYLGAHKHTPLFATFAQNCNLPGRKVHIGKMEIQKLAYSESGAIKSNNDTAIPVALKIVTRYDLKQLGYFTRG